MDRSGPGVSLGPSVQWGEGPSGGILCCVLSASQPTPQNREVRPRRCSLLCRRARRVCVFARAQALTPTFSFLCSCDTHECVLGGAETKAVP